MVVRRGYRKVPRKIIINGEEKEGMKLISRADSELTILQDQMAFQGLEQGHRTIKLPDKSVIECWSGFGLSHVNIFTSGFLEGGGEEFKECYCDCGLAVGQIVNYLRVGCYDFMDPEQTYDVRVCVNGKRYILIAEAIPMVMYPYTNHQPVLLVYEPDPLTSPYFIGKLGCEIGIQCRISPLINREPRYRYYTNV